MGTEAVAHGGCGRCGFRRSTASRGAVWGRCGGWTVAGFAPRKRLFSPQSDVLFMVAGLLQRTSPIAMHRIIVLLAVAALSSCERGATAPEPSRSVEFRLETGPAEIGTQSSGCPGNVCWTAVAEDEWSLTGRVIVSEGSLAAEGPGAPLSAEVDLAERACYWSNCPEYHHVTSTRVSSGSYGLETSPPASRYLLSLYNGAMIFEGDRMGEEVRGQVIWMSSTGPNGIQFRAPFVMRPVASS